MRGCAIEGGSAPAPAEGRGWWAGWPARSLRDPDDGVLLLALGLGGVPTVLLSAAANRGLIGPGALVAGLLLLLAVQAHLTRRDPRAGLASFALVLSLTPELPLLHDNLRASDFLFGAILLLWLCGPAGRKPLRLPCPSVSAPYLLLVGVGLVSTLLGLAAGLVEDAWYSSLLQVKRVEYLVLFWVVATSAGGRDWPLRLAVVLVLAGALVAGWGLIFPSEADPRRVIGLQVTGPAGENYNTLSGYLVLCLCTGLACSTVVRRSAARVALLVSSGICGLAVLLSFSRQGWIILVISLVVLAFTRFRRPAVAALVAVGAALALSPPVRDNVRETLRMIRESGSGRPEANSLTARYQGWTYRLDGWFLPRPLLGSGPGSVPPSVDNEYVLRACESGVVGVGLFLAWLLGVGRFLVRLAGRSGIASSLACAVLAAYAGLLVQASVAPAFTSSRVMEAFWLLLGLVAAAAAPGREEGRACAS